MKLLTIITISFNLIYILINRNSPLLFNLSNSTFIIGIIYLFIGLIYYVRNVGFFKLISYHVYRRRKIKSSRPKSKNKNIKDKMEEKLKKDYTHDEEILEFHEFIEEHYKKPWDNKIYFTFSIPLLILSYILAYFT